MTTDPPRRVGDLLSHWATVQPDAIFLAQDGVRLSYGEALDAVTLTARTLAAQGLRGGDRMMIVGENSIHTIVALLAAQTLDAWPAMANARLPSSEIDKLRSVVDPRFVLFDVGQSPAASGHATRASAEPTPGFDTMLIGHHESSRPEPVFVDAARQVGIIIFTSGTTGRPKAVMHSHASLIAMGRALASARQTRRGDLYSGAAPLAHVLGTAILMNTLAAGAGLDLQARLSLPELAASIARGETTHLSFVPMAYAQLADLIAQREIDISGHQLKYLSAGGAPLAQALKDRIEALFGVPLVNAYGMTECAPGTRSIPRIGSPAANIGFAEQGSETALWGVDGDSVPPGHVGELMMRGTGMMLGYYRDAEATQASLRDGGWLATGDLARILEDGSIEIVGRAKEMIIHNGFNVYPAEVEQAIATIDGVLQSAVIGIPLDDGNEEVVAVVQPRPGWVLEAEAIASALQSLLAAYKRPSHIIVRPDLPTGVTGKVLKAVLYQELVP